MTLNSIFQSLVGFIP